jgi:hypothetical protein
MNQTKYSKLECAEEITYSVSTRFSRFFQRSALAFCLSYAVAFCAGVLLALGGISLHKNFDQQGIKLLR